MSFFVIILIDRNIGDDMSQKKVKKRKLKKAKLFSFVFCVYSIVFFIFCLCFYGFRLVKYYKIYNPKSENGEKIELLSSHISQNTSIVYDGDGLYKDGGSYIFKGTNINNYITYSGLLWRIVKINNDGTIDIILNDHINDLMWNSKITKYMDSDIHKYLNDKFLSILNQEYLEKTSICTDVISDLQSITCEKVNKEDYVKLINITDYLNSKSEKTFINDDDSLWTSDASKEEVWYIGKDGISSNTSEEFYRIKPEVTLKSALTLIDGDGTKENPYKIETDEKKLRVGSYVKLGEDTWIIYEKNKEDMKLILSGLYNNGNVKKAFDTYSNKFNPDKKNSFAHYLNTTYLDSLSYKDILLDTTWNIGDYTESYEDVEDSTVSAKVGTYNVSDFKFENNLDNYFMITPQKSGIAYVYGKKTIYYKVSRMTAVRPAISIKIYDIKSGEGTKTRPYELEVTK